VSGDIIVGDVERATVVVIDDLIASGGTMDRAARTALAHGAKEVFACAAHGLFTGNANSTLAAAPLNHLIVTDTVPPFRLDAKFVTTHVETLSAAPLFADCIKCLHGGSSISQLLGDED
jgi:ribose-phosphate pyrophosphokinase